MPGGICRHGRESDGSLTPEVIGSWQEVDHANMPRPARIEVFEFMPYASPRRADSGALNSWA
jgi:hypothetical protein